MSYLALTDKYLITTKNLEIDFYDFSNHLIIEIPTTTQTHDNDHASDIIISSDNKYVAVMTSYSKRLVIYELPVLRIHKTFTLPRSASKIRFAANNKRIFVADKSGDVLLYNIEEEDSGTKLLGHLSLLLDVLQTNDEKYIITSDRDEKIRVSCYPNTYNIETFCLGHKEFVNHLELLPHDNKYLTSTSGDGTVKIWEYTKGKPCYTINTNIDVNDDQLIENFVNSMDADGVEVTALPIAHYAVAQLNESSSLLAIAVHSSNTLLIYSVQTTNGHFNHKLEDKLKIEQFPTALKFHKLKLHIYNQSDCHVMVYKVLQENNKVSIEFGETITMFENTKDNSTHVENCFESIKVLYKRKFDNVLEYQERKRLRLENSAQ